MRLLTIILLMVSQFVTAQDTTTISPLTTIQQFSTYKPGYYRYQIKDTITDFTKDTALVVTVKVPVLVTIHDTLKIKLTKSDSLAIQALKICPVTPCPTQRVANGMSWESATKRWVIYYSDGTKTYL